MFVEVISNRELFHPLEVGKQAKSKAKSSCVRRKNQPTTPTSICRHCVPTTHEVVLVAAKTHPVVAADAPMTPVSYRAAIAPTMNSGALHSSRP